ncbi:hypothetical protein [Spongiactinospora sp. TRM90649]|uniref:hypothetical protein n=1 Tax=Spongiactinospora sp. TRM90649 TaxID=3031114 RepID=UPI0023F8953A|nr:hypothetical protein [Spongiactinospora sp. TRM90649]MDF5754090.1 hypothetical protein [Spongiactinospora sp. TRM90649]
MAQEGGRVRRLAATAVIVAAVLPMVAPAAAWAAPVRGIDPNANVVRTPQISPCHDLKA